MWEIKLTATEETKNNKLLFPYFPTLNLTFF